jgi:hypothetical protein
MSLGEKVKVKGVKRMRRKKKKMRSGEKDQGREDPVTGMGMEKGKVKMRRRRRRNPGLRGGLGSRRQVSMGGLGVKLALRTRVALLRGEVIV